MLNRLMSAKNQEIYDEIFSNTKYFDDNWVRWSTLSLLTFTEEGRPDLRTNLTQTADWSEEPEKFESSHHIEWLWLVYERLNLQVFRQRSSGGPERLLKSFISDKCYVWVTINREISSRRWQSNLSFKIVNIGPPEEWLCKL